jgi:hypothetical protein
MHREGGFDYDEIVRRGGGSSEGADSSQRSGRRETMHSCAMFLDGVSAVWNCCLSVQLRAGWGRLQMRGGARFVVAGHAGTLATQSPTVV